MVALPELESRTVVAVRQAREATQRAHHSIGLSPSGFDTDCDRQLFYKLRWAYPAEIFDGQKLRLFETGNIEEDRIVASLQAAGLQVRAVDEETGKQFPARLLGGHVRGKLDGFAENVPEAPKTVHVLECKSHNDKSFKALKKDGVQKSKPAHYAQMQIYMAAWNAARALYYAVNKNDDAEYAERIEFDPIYVGQLLARAERVITAERAPSRAHDDPTSKAAFACGWCPAKALCHGGEWAPRHCRTCMHSTARLDGDARWVCELHGRDIDLDVQRDGCAHHRFLPDFVPGEQADAADDGSWVAYQLPSGPWRDVGPYERPAAGAAA